MEIESSLVAAQNALTINPTVREPQRQAEAREQQAKQANTELPRAKVVARQAQPEAFEQADRFRQQQNYTEQNGASKNQQAINAYTRLSNDQQRQEIQQLFGVDTYA